MREERARKEQAARQRNSRKRASVSQQALHRIAQYRSQSGEYVVGCYPQHPASDDDMKIRHTSEMTRTRPYLTPSGPLGSIRLAEHMSIITPRSDT